MSHPGAPRPRSHRASGAGELARRLGPPLLALAVVVGVVVGLIAINGHSTGARSSEAVTGGSTGLPASATGPPPAGTAVRPGHRTAPPIRARPRPAPRGATSHRAAPTTSPSGSPPRPRRRPRAAVTGHDPIDRVEVLNNSTRGGLAHQVAAELETRGWPVYYVGNLRGRVLASTVYYAVGDAPAAHRLAAQFPAVRRVLPEADLGLSTTGLTLVTTRDWYG